MRRMRRDGTTISSPHKKQFTIARTTNSKITFLVFSSRFNSYLNQAQTITTNMTTSLKPTCDELPPQGFPLQPLSPSHMRSESKGTAHDFWKHYQERPLDAIFRPKSVAVIGASEKQGSVGKFVEHELWNSCSAS